MHERIPEPLKALVEQLSRLPGLGPKSAMRAAMALLKWPEAETRRLGRGIHDLRDNLHRTADDIDGDATRFNATADSDRFVVNDIGNRPWFTRSGVQGPESMAQLEAQLNVLQIPLLAL